MKKKLQTILIIELQIILALIVFVIIKISLLNDRMFNTNSFLHQLLADKNMESIQKIDDNDIIIGDKNAPYSIIMYTKFECIYCREFFETTFPDLQNEYIEQGDVNMAVRFLISPVSDQFKLVQIAYEAYKANLYNDFTNLINSYNIDELNSENIAQIQSSLGLSIPENVDFITEKYSQARKAGISRTPTFIIDNKKIVGNRKLGRFRLLINSQLDSCH